MADIIFDSIDLKGRKFNGEKIAQAIEAAHSLDPGTIAISADLNETKNGLEATRIIIHDASDSISKEDVKTTYKNLTIDKDEHEEAAEAKEDLDKEDLERLFIKALNNQQFLDAVKNKLGI